MQRAEAATQSCSQYKVFYISSKFTGEDLCRSVISIKFLCKFIEITLQHGCLHVNLMHIFRTSYPQNTSGWLLLNVQLDASQNTTTGVTMRQKLLQKIYVYEQWIESDRMIFVNFLSFRQKHQCINIFVNNCLLAVR